jgi:gluconate 5-dehydrogenase
MRYDDLFRLDEQTAMVFGGYGGIGTELCRGLAHYGANIVVAGRDAQKAKGLAREIEGTGRRASGLQVDATVADDVRQGVATVVNQFGRIDIMVNCVGAQVDTPAEDYKEGDWDRIVGVNLKAAFLTAQAVGRIMIKQKRGKIIILTSVRSALGIRSGFSAYCSAKGGMNMLTKQLATEWAKHNINVNAIAPTFIRTEQVANYLTNREFYEKLVARIPLGRVGETIDLVGATVLLASPASDFISGHVLFVDGGVTACQ